jgi:hypothetical protein
MFAHLVPVRPLSLGDLEFEIQDKTTRMARLPTPKLVILAGSNGPYSHSCAVIGAILNLPCENAGIAVGIGLDDLFAIYDPDLHPGDVVYMPLETAQYILTRWQNDVGPDGPILLRLNGADLRRFPPDRILGAIFSISFLDIVESMVEIPLAGAGTLSASKLIETEYNNLGDRIGTSLATSNQSILAHASRQEPDGAAISEGYGSSLVRQFVAKETHKGIAVIGGLPTDFQTVPLPADAIAAIRAIFVENGGRFVVLSNLSRYPRADFYDSEDHLAQPCQYKQSIAIAGLLGQVLRRPLRPTSPDVSRIAATCPA